ncbi:RHS repeat domain-containing protein [Candidatus Rhabdochlamydia porcellionis]|jgi:RHS repeat-associated protein|uniref:RHS Repeat n=1 Tax=Candidatus Rhabdochlamydia porcellionis TaxID=225148 RepID=A0ABX8YZ67_9BACT|nr:RHS repeat-associated core domain-containing protein [Candidatus Rhabdochlamydia porcellionis]QZA58587.1 RHS Repeat [Candidatus Rhabdochlamydia porcellionis]
MRWLLCFILTSQLIAAPFENVEPSTPVEIASLSAHLLIDGYISPLSGQISLQETDLLIKAAQDLMLKRTYVPPQILGRYEDKDRLDRLSLGKALLLQERRRWVMLPHLWAGYNLHSPYFQVYDPSGFVLEFEICDAKGILKTSSYGFSNLRQEEPDSTADLRNIEFFVEQDAVRIIWPEGTERIYRKQSPTLYRLETELLPYGKALRYEYNNQGLSRILSTDKSGKHIYASITKSGVHSYIGSDGREAKFNYGTFEIKAKAKLKKVKESLSFRTPILTQASNPTYTNFMQYNERSLLSYYDAKEYPVSFEYSQQKGFVARIQRLNTPSGSVLFSYDPSIAGQKDGWTKAEYENGASILYRFDQNLLLVAMENWHEGKLINQKTFSYNPKQHIQRIETRDGMGNLLLAHIYECDSEGNALLEQIKGDFGTFSIRRTFTTKGRLIREERDDGLGAEYTYLENTRLLTSKTVLDWGRPIRKTTYLYDEANNLIQETEEGKTYTKYILKTQEPHLHRVQREEKHDWEDQLIHKIHFTYDDYGNSCKEEHFGSDGNLAYTIKRIFDAYGNLLEETNPLNQVASYQYDHRGRCIHEVLFSNKLSIDRTFDEKGRLTLLKEADHITCFTYNALDDLIEKTDYLGLKTNYTYHPVHHKPIFIESPPTLLKITYDSFGREIQRCDAYEAKTTTRYNSYGKPIEIVDPDLGVEIYQYEPNGLLSLQIDPDGLKTAFTYDALGRLLSKTVGSYITCFTYDAYHLIKQIDPQGITTRYKYDLAGQKIEEVRANRTTKFCYDALGFLAAKEKAGRYITYVHDQMGQLLTKSIDGLLTTHWTYDSAGLIATIKRAGTFSFTYDPYDRLIEMVDEEGAKTNITYDEKEQILVKTIRDPRNKEIIETYNAHNLLLKREIPGSVSEEFEYDRALRLMRQGPLRFSYTLKGNQASLTEKEIRTTFWTYTPGGKIQTKTKPDGALLCYEYNSQGELIKVGSRQFQYDRLSRLIQGNGFSRTLDPFGNILREEFSNGLLLESTYDDWNRPLERTLPDYSRIIYEYEGPYLKRVVRLNSNGSILYTHTYDQYNEVGLTLSETGLFQTMYTYDKTGVRRTSQINPYLNDTLTYDEAGNLMQRGSIVYTYDNASQLTSETNKFTAQYDQYYNCIEKNKNPQPVDAINQIQGLPYDANGNLTKPSFCFDVFDQLIQAAGEDFVYDALGRRLQKGHTSYLYIDDEEIGSFEAFQPQELKIPGYQNIVAIEIKKHPYAPVQDVQGTIRYLIDWKTKKIAQENICDAFGMGLTEAIPYAYAGKRYDAKTNPIYFGKRYYDPELSRWLTRDPLGPIDHSNLYQYVFNNPFAYRDPAGEFVLTLPPFNLGCRISSSLFNSFCRSDCLYSTHRSYCIGRL